MLQKLSPMIHSNLESDWQLSNQKLAQLRRPKRLQLLPKNLSRRHRLLLVQQMLEQLLPERPPQLLCPLVLCWLPEPVQLALVQLAPMQPLPLASTQRVPRVVQCKVMLQLLALLLVAARSRQLAAAAGRFVPRHPALHSIGSTADLNIRMKLTT